MTLAHSLLLECKKRLDLGSYRRVKRKVAKVMKSTETQATLYGGQPVEKHLIISRLWNNGIITKNEAAVLAGFSTTGEKGNVYKIRLELP